MGACACMREDERKRERGKEGKRKSVRVCLPALHIAPRISGDDRLADRGPQHPCTHKGDLPFPPVGICSTR